MFVGVDSRVLVNSIIYHQRFFIIIHIGCDVLVTCPSPLQARYSLPPHKDHFTFPIKLQKC